MTRTLKFGIALTTTIALYQVTTAANGSGMSNASAAQPTMSPAAMARDAYNSGIEHKDKGKKLEEQAATQPDKDREKTTLKARDEYTKALKDFQKATELDPSLYQAFNGLGYAYRKTGDYQKALQNYDKALAMAPSFPDALEYRGEAYLGLNRVDDAKDAYMAVFAMDRKQADDLLKAMSTWVTVHQAAASGVDPAVVAALDTWIKDRMKIAATTAPMSLAGNRSIWK